MLPIDKKDIPTHIIDDDVIQATEHRRPNPIKDFNTAKLILQTASGDTGDTIYDHLTKIITRVIDEQPPDVCDYFEEYSRKIKEDTAIGATHTNQIEQIYLEPRRLESAKKVFSLIKLPPPSEFPGAPIVEEETAGEDEEKREPLIKDVMHLQFFWKFAGFGFPPHETYMLSCSLRRLEESPIIADTKFWGKINGLKKNYLVVEVVLTDEEILKRNELEATKEETPQKPPEEEINPNLIPHPKYNEMTNIPIVDGLEIPPVMIKPPPTVRDLPKSLYTNPRDIPTEGFGHGINRRTYFVCNQPHEDWTELPIVTPKQITVSRQIKKFLTGNLDHDLKSFPVFPGTERNYLRAIIERISSSTHISPQGYYKIGSGDDEEEEEEEEGEGNNDKAVTEDPTYEPQPIRDLLDPSFWVHHRPNILKQGRVKWINPKKIDKNNDEEEAEEEEDEDDEEEKIEPETGPSLMTPCAEDATIETIPPWTIRLQSICNPKNPMILVRSNIWPGAFTFALGRTVQSLYIGWGDKFTTRNYSPTQIPPIEEEYPIGPEIMEINDPTIEEEEEWRIAHEKLSKEDIDEEGGEEGEEEEDEEQD